MEASDKSGAGQWEQAVKAAWKQVSAKPCQCQAVARHRGHLGHSTQWQWRNFDAKEVDELLDPAIEIHTLKIHAREAKAPAETLTLEINASFDDAGEAQKGVTAATNGIALPPLPAGQCPVPTFEGFMANQERFEKDIEKFVAEKNKTRQRNCCNDNN